MKIILEAENKQERVALGNQDRLAIEGCFEYVVTGLHAFSPAMPSTPFRRIGIGPDKPYQIGRLYAAIEEVRSWAPSPIVQPPTDS